MNTAAPLHSSSSSSRLPVAAIASGSPEAAARVLVLAIVADGRLGACEVQALDDAHAYERLGLPRERFYQVMREVCAGLLERQARTGDSMFKLDGEEAHAWLDAVPDLQVRQEVLTLAFEVIRSDGQLHPGESRLFWQALDRWGVRLDAVRLARGARQPLRSAGAGAATVALAG